METQVNGTQTVFSQEVKRKKLHEALWKQSVSRTHKLFCDCPNFLYHFKPWSATAEGDGEKTRGEDDFGVNFDLGFVEKDEDIVEELRYAG